ncbi:MAG: folylpolyglutamate synthase/dihydrofolate synthase family protein [Opitutaceae bacterium]|jgi:dihydrofolate synthase / folylpolyglutamate synthase
MSVEPSLADYAAVQDYLFGLKAQGLKFGIDRMRLLAAAIGQPERAVPCVHVAGTNGKGSVSAMLDAILQAAGLRRGLYTSPHLVRLGERVQVNRQILSESEIMAYARELRPIAAQLAATGGADDHPSFFEFMTAMAFLQFARKSCDVNVIEVGMGGRLDATNIVTPVVSVITSIGLDHCEMLGHTIELIAAEKSGIIKPGVPVVMGRVPLAAERVIRARAKECDSPLLSVGEVFGADLATYPPTNLEGDYQRWNAATATLVARELAGLWPISEAQVVRGLTHVDWPGRWQRIRLGGRLVVLDASHNPEGAQILETSLARLVQETGRAPIVVTGVLGAVRARPLLETISRYAAEIHFVVPQQARACGYLELEALVPTEFGERGGRIVRSSVDAIFPGEDRCNVGGPDDIVVVTGSIYLLGEIMARLAPQRGPGEGRLQDF